MTLAILVVASIAIITLDARGGFHRIASGLRSTAADAFSPVRSVVDGIVEPIGSFLAGAVHYGAVRQENAKLRQELGTLELRDAEASDATQALTQLKALLALDNLPYYANLTLEPAQVIEYGPSNFAATVTISVGRDQGATLGMPVVGEGGLIGSIVQANHNSAVVRLITDGRSSVGVRYGPSPGSLAVVNGHGSGHRLAASLVPNDAPLRAGEVMTTSGLQGAVYPPGIPVAKVVGIRTGTSSSQESVTLAPLADLARLRYVDVVLWGPPS
ncbi:MAG: rod shape-determining protein MreC [Actinomycetota bacterium]|nr:rod shape-determining protein MreC [Actinomycetota bacterium]